MRILWKRNKTTQRMQDHTQHTIALIRQEIKQRVAFLVKEVNVYAHLILIASEKFRCTKSYMNCNRVYAYG